MIVCDLLLKQLIYSFIKTISKYTDFVQDSNNEQRLALAVSIFVSQDALVRTH